MMDDYGWNSYFPWVSPPTNPLNKKKHRSFSESILPSFPRRSVAESCISCTQQGEAVLEFPGSFTRNWLVVWLPFFIFPSIGLLIIPIDEVIFFRGVQPKTTKQVWFDLSGIPKGHHPLFHVASILKSSWATVRNVTSLRLQVYK